GLLEPFLARRCGDDVVAGSVEHGLKEIAQALAVVDYQDPLLQFLHADLSRAKLRVHETCRYTNDGTPMSRQSMALVGAGTIRRDRQHQVLLSAAPPPSSTVAVKAPCHHGPLAKNTSAPNSMVTGRDQCGIDERGKLVCQRSDFERAAAA